MLGNSPLGDPKQPEPSNQTIRPGFIVMKTLKVGFMTSSNSMEQHGTANL